MTRDPSLLINILAPEPKAMKIPTKPITLDILTALGPEGLAILADQIRALGDAHESVQHGATLASIADALVPALASRDAADEAARQREVSRCERMRDQASRDVFMVAAGRAFRLTYTAKGEDARVPTSREMATAAKAHGRFDRVKWNGATWIIIPAHWRNACLDAERQRNERAAAAEATP